MYIYDDSDIERFWSHVDKQEFHWIWTSQLRTGYGMFMLKRSLGNKSPVGAHRFSFFLDTGIYPGKQIVRHKCDIPACVKPECLELGSHTDNMRDMLERDRSFSDLTNQQVIIARKRAALKESVYAIAIDLNVDYKKLRNAVRGKTFNHLNEPIVPDANIEYFTGRKLSQQDLFDIREAFKKPYWGINNDLAKKYGVSFGQISNIKLGFVYKDK